MLSLEIVGLVSHFADALAELDATRPVGGGGRFRPGVGPLTETEVTAGVLSHLKLSAGAVYGGCGPRSYPNGRATCDLVIPNAWALELKLARPYGDNGKPASVGPRTCCIPTRVIRAPLAIA